MFLMIYNTFNLGMISECIVTNTILLPIIGSIVFYTSSLESLLVAP